MRAMPVIKEMWRTLYSAVLKPVTVLSILVGGVACAAWAVSVGLGYVSGDYPEGIYPSLSLGQLIASIVGTVVILVLTLVSLTVWVWVAMDNVDKERTRWK